jgi:cell pole-organizing protein PopZ
MVQPAKGQEPSMEGILASIRRIIADDDTARVQPPKPAATVAPPPEPTPQSPEVPPRLAWPGLESERLSVSPAVETPGDFPQPASFAHEPEPADDAPPDILDLADEMAAETVHATGFRGVEDLDVVFAERPPLPRPQPAPSPVAVDPPAAASTSWSAPERRDYPPPRNDPAPARSEANLMSATTSAAVDSAFNTLAQTVLVQNGRTLEDLVREMLRPMLKSWLDDNLPGLVERLVRAEIERVSRGRP